MERSHSAEQDQDFADVDRARLLARLSPLLPAGAGLIAGRPASGRELRIMLGQAAQDTPPARLNPLAVPLVIGAAGLPERGLAAGTGSVRPERTSSSAASIASAYVSPMT